MKRTLLLTLAVVLVASTSMAQQPIGHVGVFSDPTATSCDIQDIAGIVHVYVCHVEATIGARASQFKVDMDPSLSTLTYIAESVSIGLSIGDALNGIAISYNTCVSTFPLELIHIQFFGTGTITSCGKFQIVQDPAQEDNEIAFVDCSSNLVLTGTLDGSAMVNATGDCGCNVANEETSWSKIKALYQ
jgi:hypothetical protein